MVSYTPQALSLSLLSHPRENLCPGRVWHIVEWLQSSEPRGFTHQVQGIKKGKRLLTVLSSYYEGVNFLVEHMDHNMLYSCPRAAITKGHTLRDLNKSTVVSHASGGRQSEIKVSTKLVPSEGCEGESIPGLSPWLVHGCLLPLSLPIAFPLLLVCLCVQMSPFL